MDKLIIRQPVIVEGRYDKNTLSQVMEGTILCTDGFSLFHGQEKVALIRRLAAAGGVIVLTDSDGGGRQIRRYLSSILPKEQLIHLHIPRVAGKEKRKRHPSGEGWLGVEGMDAGYLRGLLAPLAVREAPPPKAGLSKADFYRDGLSGGEGSAARRAALAERLGLPTHLTANALLEAINLLCTREAYAEALSQLDNKS